MKNSELFSVGARLIGLILALKLLVTLPHVALAVTESPFGYGLYSLFILGMEVVIVGLLLFAPKVIGRFLFKRDTRNEEAETGWSLQDFQRTAFSILGMFFIIQSIIMFSVILMSLQHVSNGFQSKFVFNTSMQGLIPELVQLALGLWLLFGSRGLWRIIRYAQKTD